jgi:hypothetical protein
MDGVPALLKPALLDLRAVRASRAHGAYNAAGLPDRDQDRRWRSPDRR